MAHLLEALGRLGANPLRGTILADQLEEASIDFVVASAQGVVFGIRNRRRVLLVVALVVLPDFAGQPRELLLRLDIGQLSDRLVLETTHARARFLGVSPKVSASASSRRAAPRASSVTLVPESIRAISSRRSRWSSSATRVASPARVIRKCRDARAAT